MIKYKVLKSFNNFLDAHDLSMDEIMDTDYLEDLAENYKEMFDVELDKVDTYWLIINYQKHKQIKNS